MCFKKLYMNTLKSCIAQILLTIEVYESEFYFYGDLQILSESHEIIYLSVYKLLLQGEMIFPYEQKESPLKVSFCFHGTL